MLKVTVFYCIVSKLASKTLKINYKNMRLFYLGPEVGRRAAWNVQKYNTFDSKNGNSWWRRGKRDRLLWIFLHNKWMSNSTIEDRIFSVICWANRSQSDEQWMMKASCLKRLAFREQFLWSHHSRIHFRNTARHVILWRWSCDSIELSEILHSISFLAFEATTQIWELYFTFDRLKVL